MRDIVEPRAKAAAARVCVRLRTYNIAAHLAQEYVVAENAHAQQVNRMPQLFVPSK